MTLVVEWDEASAMRLAEAVWNAGGTVRLLIEPALHKESALACDAPAAPTEACA